MSNQNFNEAEAAELRSCKSEKDLMAFIEKHKSHPAVQGGMKMCSGRDPYSVASNVSNAMKIPFQEFRQFVGF